MGSEGVGLLCSELDTLSSCSAREQVQKLKRGGSRMRAVDFKKETKVLESELEQQGCSGAPATGGCQTPS